MDTIYLNPFMLMINHENILWSTVYDGYAALIFSKKPIQQYRLSVYSGINLPYDMVHCKLDRSIVVLNFWIYLWRWILILWTCMNISAILETLLPSSEPKSTCISILEAPTTVFGCDYVMYDVELRLRSSSSREPTSYCELNILGHFRRF